MAKVRAAYNYSYNYEGKKISFKKDEEFQLLTKSNKDWWQVRRWTDGSAQDIYVPAVYVKEVDGSGSGSGGSSSSSASSAKNSESDPTYMNLDDLKMPPKALENGRRNSAEKVSDVLSAPKPSNAFKKNSLERGAKLPLEKKPSVEVEPSSSAKANGLNPTRPISPGMLRKLGNKKPVVGASSSTPSSSSSSSSSSVAPSGSSKEGLTAGSSSSMKRGEALFPPPVSTKPRSKSSVGESSSTVESSLDHRSGGVPVQRKTSGSAPMVKSRVPPPVQSKPRGPNYKMQVARPMSMAEAGEGGIGGVEATRPIVSELSNVLLKMNPHLASSASPSSSSSSSSSHEHKPLTKSSSSGAALDSTPTGAAFRAESNLLSKSLDARSDKTSDPLPSFSVPPPPTSPPPLPAGWTEHKTDSGQTYFYNSVSGQSSWTRPQVGGDALENKYLEKVAPRGWTKEINPITRTPVYTNSRSGERWALGSDAKGNHYYYNMANSSITVGELPEVEDVDENVYDSILPVVAKGPSTPSSSPAHVTPSNIITDTIASSMSDVLKRHGYLHRKKLFDNHGKKAKEKGWIKHYVTLQGYELVFYTDLKSKESGSKPVSIFCLLQTTVSPYNKDKKKTNVFQVSSHLGEQFLLQAETSNLMNEWYSTIQTAIDQANHDYKSNPDKFKSTLLEPMDEAEGSPRISSSLNRNKKSFRSQSSRQQSTDDIDEDEDIVDDMEISAAERSGHIRGRLRKLMAKRPEKESLKSKGILEDPVFGCELSSLCERQGTKVPKFFTQFMQHIEKVGLDVVGIYRLSGNAASINKLRYLVEQDQTVDLDNPEWSDVNIVTGCLKLYLRELPDPLLPFRMYRPFLDAARAGSHPQRVQAIAGKIKELPNANYCTLKALIEHLRRVVELGSVNKMLATNVAIVFGPTVMRAETDSLEMATLMPIQNGIVEIMVNEYDAIFRK